MIEGFLKTIYPISKEPVEIEITASTIVNLQSQGHDGPNIKIQKIEYQNSILHSGFCTIGNSTRYCTKVILIQINISTLNHHKEFNFSFIPWYFITGFHQWFLSLVEKTNIKKIIIHGCYYYKYFGSWCYNRVLVLWVETLNSWWK